MKSRRILICGAGTFAEKYFFSIKKVTNVIGCISSINSNHIAFNNQISLPIFSFDEIKNIDFDEIHIANSFPETIIELKRKGISTDKIFIPYFLGTVFLKKEIDSVINKYLQVNSNQFDLNVKIISDYEIPFENSEDGLDYYDLDLHNEIASLCISLSKVNARLDKDFDLLRKI